MLRLLSILPLSMLLGCPDSDAKGPECAKVVCASDEYCLSEVGGQPDTASDLPFCAQAPADCGGSPSCDCLPECTSCAETSEGVYCEVLLP